ncbi:Actin-related protein 6 [Thelohanellus kitauei]|uniref:Actin-related protein 6 n=1 Tax=Thelohanellus kitauei TaxID=669202 RepID=A0A0C2IEX0_THEKT|nr:Actin-related protein 6 [Thelohanellus kitauei]
MNIFLKIAPHFAFYNYMEYTQKRPYALVIDSGFSFTHIVPFVRGKINLDGVVRIDVGGKLLTNYLREIISFSKVNIIDEPFIANHIKEMMCKVSMDFLHEIELYKLTFIYLRNAKNSLGYEVPSIDSNNNLTPIQASETITGDKNMIRIGHESIVVPELLFRPQLISK